jgi:hypothetical protein
METNKSEIMPQQQTTFLVPKYTQSNSFFFLLEFIITDYIRVMYIKQMVNLD